MVIRKSFVPYRNEAIEVFMATANCSQQTDIGEIFHNFFESLIPKSGKPEGINQYHTWDWDNLRYIVQELFIYCVAVLVKSSRFDALSTLMQQRFYIERDEDYGRNAMRGFGVLRNHLDSLEHRKNRLKLNRKSIHADLIKELNPGSGVNFNQLMQADYLLFLADSIRALNDSEWGQEWWPETLVYRSYGSSSYEVIARAESKSFFSKLAPCLGIASKSDLEPLIEAYKTRGLHSADTSAAQAINYENLCTKP